MNYMIEMGNEGLGECSRKTEGDHSGDDGSGDPERPLKKARYVWQVKGKYHLKDGFNSANKNPSETQKTEGSSSTPTEESGDNLFGNNLSLNNNNTENNNNHVNCLIKSVIAQADVVASSNDFSDDDNGLKRLNDICVPANKNPDYFLNKWQARQLAKGYLDNTINRVLESWMVSPFEDSDENCEKDLEELAGFDTDFVDNCDNDGQVEDEGILMAIQSHGLQPGVPNWGESSSNTDGSNSISFVRPQEIAESAMDNYQNVHNELKRKAADVESDNYIESIEMSNHTNFLDAAVAVAIQKKGLSSQNYM